MSTTVTEREIKFEVDLDYTVPDLTDFVPEGGRTEATTVHLVSVYYDTVDHDLLAHRITLRRRSGDTDTGWHLKVPIDKARTETRLPLAGDDDPVPAQLADLVRGVAANKPLQPVATLTTHRSLRHILDPAGELLIEVADDTVAATMAGSTTQIDRWREIEAELGTGGEALLRKVGMRLRRHGAHNSARLAKLERVLTPARSVEAPATGSPAAQAVQNYLDEQLQVIVAGDIALRRGEDPIHPTRVAIRRLRSTIRVFATLFDTTVVTHLDHELSWYAGILGHVRDREVQRARFAAAVAALPVEVVMGPVAATIETELAREQREYRAHVDDTLVTDRYLTLLAALRRWVHDNQPPLHPDVESKAVTRLSTKAGRKAATRLSTAVGSNDPDDEALHRARKAAKRARYAAELTTPLSGRKTSDKKINRYKHIQEVLGEHQDSVVASAILRDLGARAGTRPDQNGFTYGLLYANEQHAADAARHNVAQLLRST